MRVLLFVTWQKLNDCIDQIGIFDKSFLIYLPKTEKLFFRKITYLSQNSECSKWPIRAFAECIIGRTKLIDSTTAVEHAENADAYFAKAGIF